MRVLGLVALAMVTGCGDGVGSSAAANEAAPNAAPPSPVAVERESFFPLASLDAASVSGCRFQAMLFDTNRTVERAAKIVEACDRAAPKAKGKCLQYAVAVSSQAQKFIAQMRSIREGGPYNPTTMEYARAHTASKVAECTD